MDLVTLYLCAAGVGLLGCLSAVTIRINKIASIAHICGIVIIALLAYRYFGIWHMLAAVFTVFLSGMVLSFIVIKIKNRNKK